MTGIPERPVERTLGMPATQYIWRAYLDPIMDELMDPETDPNAKFELKAAARAYANSIAAIPGTESPDKTAQRAVTRWKIRQGNLPWEMTPGYGYADAKNDDPTEQGRVGMWPPGYAPSTHVEQSTVIACGPRRAQRKAAAPKAVTTALTDEVRAKVASMLGMGMPVAALTQRFNLTVEQVQSCKNPD